jgi:hypothetical protein
MKLWNLFDRMFLGGGADDDAAHTIDHAPIATDAYPLQAKLKTARRRHGKPFHTDERVARQSEASSFLLTLQEKAAPRQAAREADTPNISRLRARGGKA